MATTAMIVVITVETDTVAGNRNAADAALFTSHDSGFDSQR